jgi:hypothetical protein
MIENKYDGHSRYETQGQDLEIILSKNRNSRRITNL